MRFCRAIRRAGVRLPILLTALLVAASLVLVPAGTARAGAYEDKVQRQFEAWIETLWPAAKAKGVSRPVFDKAFAGLRLDWSLPDLLPPGREKAKDREKTRQPEFGSPGRYFSAGALSGAISVGRQKAGEWSKTLAAIEKRYGVPGNVILAIWGRETAYGVAKIPYDALRSLATLAFMGRRPDFFRPEVIASLEILQQEHVTRAKLKSSWAGAMGQTQMLPTKFLRFAVDFDGDGHRDIWSSIPDALATSANFMRKEGWQPGVPWGYEVRLPQRFDCTLEGPHQPKTLAQWAALGITRTYDRPMPKHRMNQKFSLLLPAGLYGPAFLVSKNFYVIKQYNESDLYSLFVGHVADRISTDRPFEGQWREVPTYTRAKVKRLQQVLVKQGYNVGDTIDGLIGFRSRVAVGQYQRKHGLQVDCWPGPETFGKAL